ncbi:MAG: MFS transporter, partial [Candidatus Bipolaricaulota bacterium]
MFKISRDAGILVVFSLVCTFGVSNIVPYIPIFGREVGMPVAMIGNLVLLYYLLQSVTRIPLGKLSDLIGHHKPVLL